MKKCLVGILVLAGSLLAFGSWRGAFSGEGPPLAFEPLYALQNGDTNGDWEVDLSDAVFLLSFLYLGGPGPVPYECGTETPIGRNGDANGDGAIDLSDAVYLLSDLFGGGPEPAPIHCGIGVEEGEGASARGGYVFKLLRKLGDPAPGALGGVHRNDFEPSAVNNHGEVLFGSDVPEGEGIFLISKGQVSEVARSGEAAPGGGTFDFGFLGPSSLNDGGDAALVFLLSPFSLPVGVNAGLYRDPHTTRTLKEVVVPSVTPAPTGGAFAGVGFSPSQNNRVEIVFQGFVPGDQGIHLPDEPYVGLGTGVFRADKLGKISAVVVPGDPAPGGGTYDWTTQGWVNDGGDVAFVGHVAGEECRAAGFNPQAIIVGCLGSLYMKKAATGEVRSVAHAGDPAPGGSVFRQAYSPVMNNRGEVAFLGDLSAAPDANLVVGVYLHSGGVTTAIARPGDAMPGGGTMVTASTINGNQLHVNNLGEVAFNCVLDSGTGSPETGLFVWSRGSLRLVARTGTVVPDVGTVAQLVMGVIVIPPPPVLVPNSGAVSNDLGQVLFGATLSDGQGVLLLAIPRP